MSISARRYSRRNHTSQTPVPPPLPTRETFDYPTAVWPQGSTGGDGRYRVIHDGAGTVQITADKRLRLESAVQPVVDEWGDTASSLVVSTNSVGDFDETVRLITLAQLRSEATGRGVPNPWEVAWFGWHYTQTGNDNAYYYVILKPTGLELAKVDQRIREPDNSYTLPGGQRYFYTDTTPYPINTWYTLRVRQSGATLDIWVDGVHITTFTDGEAGIGTPVWNPRETVLTSGAWVYYHEDARVEFDDGPYVPAP